MQRERRRTKHEAAESTRSAEAGRLRRSLRAIPYRSEGLLPHRQTVKTREVAVIRSMIACLPGASRRRWVFRDGHHPNGYNNPPKDDKNERHRAEDWERLVELHEVISAVVLGALVL